MMKMNENESEEEEQEEEEEKRIARLSPMGNALDQALNVSSHSLSFTCAVKWPHRPLCVQRVVLLF